MEPEADPGDDAEPHGYLRRVYGIDDPLEIRDYYDNWAASYDAELRENGYATPGRVAAALADLAPGLDTPVLDYGCGTGMSGEALAAAGFTTIDGADPSHGMLRVAASKGVYRDLIHLDIDAPEPPFVPGSRAIVTAIGLIGPGAAPLGLFDQLLALVAPGGLFVVSFNDRALDIPEFAAKVAEVRAAGGVDIVFEELGSHLPGLGNQSMVYVFQRAA